MSRASSVIAFRKAVKLLKEIDPDLSVYVANDVMHLMKGPSHDRLATRALYENVIDDGYGVRISGGDW